MHISYLRKSQILSFKNLILTFLKLSLWLITYLLCLVNVFSTDNRYSYWYYLRLSSWYLVRLFAGSRRRAGME